MNTIELQQTLPAVFAGRDSIISDVWHQSLTLKRGEAYLVVNVLQLIVRGLENL